MSERDELERLIKIRAIHTLRVNVKSLANEARIIRQESRRAGALYRNDLAYHRRVVVRKEARIAQLALAFVRGRQYESVEPKTRESRFERLELIDKVVKKVMRHSNSMFYAADIMKWLGEKSLVK